MTITTNHSSRALLIALIPMIAALSRPASAEQMRSITHVYKNGQNHHNLVLNYGAAARTPAPAPPRGPVGKSWVDREREVGRQRIQAARQQAVQQQQMELRQRVLQSQMHMQEKTNAVLQQQQMEQQQRVLQSQMHR